MNEEIYLNGIPVYRKELNNNEIEYVLFHNDRVNGSLLILESQNSRIDEYKIVLKAISDMTGSNEGWELGISARKGLPNKLAGV